MRRVVVTGLGIIPSIGNNVQEVLASLREAKSGIVKAEAYEKLGFRCQVHGAPTYDLDTVERARRARSGLAPSPCRPPCRAPIRRRSPHPSASAG